MTSRFLLALLCLATSPLLGQDPPARAPGSIEVTPRGGAASGVAPSSTASFSFQVTSTRAVSTVVELSCLVSGQVTSCTPDQTEFTLAGFASTDVSVEITTGTAGSGTVSLFALGFEFDSGWRNITVQGISPPTVTQPRQADSVFNRAHCLTSDAGLGAWSCGDGLLFLSTPSVTTLERQRNLTLVHATNTVAPLPLVMAEVTPAAGSPTLDHVTAVLAVRDTIRRTAVYSGWSTGTMQIVLGWDASAHPTGVYPYTLTVRAVGTSDSASTTVSGNLLVVNRSQSPYGKGWEWLGVERLVFNQPAGSGQTHLMWVGGDGSAKLYRQASAGVWVTPRESFPDTIKSSGGEYTRYGRHWSEVVFDASGRHIRTENRADQITRFYWNSDRIDSVRVPPAGTGGRTFRMKYDGSNKLDSVVVATGKGVNVTVASGLLTNWAWPDGTSQGITSDASGRPSTTLDSRGSATRWIYGTHGLLTEARVYYAVNDSAVTRFTPWQAAGFASGVGTHAPGDTASAVTTIFGPRVGVNDDAVFHVDRWGAVTEVRDALGMKTKFHRTDAVIPALVTRVDYPNSRRALMTWNARGNLTRLTDSTWGTRAFPKLVTTWAYNSANAPDSPSSVKSPAGDSVRYAYTTLGLTDSIIDQRAHRTKFVYAPAHDSVRGQVVQIIERAVPTWIESTLSESTSDQTTTLTYFSTGNIRTVLSPSGGRQRLVRDADGRIIADTNAVGLLTTYTWDAMDRQTRRIVGRLAGSGTSGTCVSAEFTCTDLVLDALNPTGTADTTQATYTQGFLTQLRDPRGVLRQYRYDLRGLMVAELDEANAVDSARFDPAGLVTTHRTRLGANVTSTYDVLGRLTKTVIPARPASIFGRASSSVPADSVVTVYDSIGNALSVANRNGIITRSYFETGHVRSERVVPVSGRSLADSVWYAYDTGGRLRRVSWLNGDSVVYRYNAASDLDTMRVHLEIGPNPGDQRLELWRFVWDTLGRRRTVHYPYNSMTVSYRYDRLGTLRRVISTNPGSAYGSDRFEVTVAQDQVDVLGRPLKQTTTCSGVKAIAWPCGDWLPDSTTNRYNRWGALVVQSRTTFGATPVRDTMRYDRSGNMISRRNGISASGPITTFVYTNLSNRIQSRRDSVVGSAASTFTYGYDAAGSRIRMNKPIGADTTAWQYDALSRLVGTARRYSIPGDSIFLEHYNECRWDAAWRLAQPCGTGGQLAFVGQNVSRSSLGWFFVQAPGIDETLLLMYRGVPGPKRLQAVTDGRGQLVAIADSSGDITAEFAGSGYDQAAWKGGGLTSRAQTFDPRKWQTDEEWGGIQQFRHRAYDPATANWIQEDPLGVSGGVNLYRFNRGNPASFSDPFGLQPCPPNCTPLHAAAGGVFGALGALSMGAAGAVAGTFVAPGLGTVSGGTALGVTGGVLGAAAGVSLVNAVTAVADAATTVSMASVKDWFRRLVVAGGILVGGGPPDRTSRGENPPQQEQPATPTRPTRKLPKQEGERDP